MASSLATSPLVAAARDRVHYLDKVPSDIAISQALTPIPIAQIAADAGILPAEFDQYGPFKGKVHLSVRDRLKAVRNGVFFRVPPLPERTATSTRGDDGCLLFEGPLFLGVVVVVAVAAYLTTQPCRTLCWEARCRRGISRYNGGSTWDGFDLLGAGRHTLAP